MATLVKLNPAKLESSRDLPVHGQRSQTLFSPFDIPREVAVGYDQQRNVVCFQFLYLGDEGSEPAQVQVAPVSFLVGRNSKRLREINVTISQSVMTDDLTLTAHLESVVSTALQRLIEQAPDSQRASGTVFFWRLIGPERNVRMNYRIIDFILKKHREEIFRAAAQLISMPREELETMSC